jgi:hypothetical protein
VKTITFTVQIQADLPQASQTPTAVTRKLCDNINNILAKHDGMIGGAQIIPAPRSIKVATMPDD